MPVGTSGHRDTLVRRLLLLAEMTGQGLLSPASVLSPPFADSTGASPCRSTMEPRVLDLSPHRCLGRSLLSDLNTVPDPGRHGLFLAPMQRRDKQNVVTALDLVRLFALKLPVRIIDEDQDSWAAGRRLAMLPICPHDVAVAAFRGAAGGGGPWGTGVAGDQLSVRTCGHLGRTDPSACLS